MLKVLSIIFFVLCVEVSLSAKLSLEEEVTTTTEEPKEIIPILKDERDGPLHGNFKFNFETGDGIKRQEEGNSQGTRQGVISFPLPNGEIFELKFKAGPNGFQPESDFLPKAPVFPHPIPEHAKEQLLRHRG